MSHALSPVSQLLERNQSLFAGKRLLIAGYLEDNFALHLQTVASCVSIFCTDYHRYRALQTSPSSPNLTLEFGHQPRDTDARYDALLLLLPKAKRESQYLLACLTPLLPPGADLFLAGENRGGINGADKLLALYGDGSSKLDSARRCSLVHCRLNAEPARFCLEQWVTNYAIPVDTSTVNICALPGVFSADALDEGSALLLAHTPPLHGRVLDLGCGAGVIGAVLAHRYPDIKLELCDINALALESSRRTLAANGMHGEVHASDMLSDIAPGIDFLITNPPFHAGLNTLYAPTEQMITAAPGRLAKGGKMLLVANAFLRYPPYLERAFERHSVIAENRKFRLYLAS